MKKLIAALLSVCVVGGNLPAIYGHSPNIAAFASAEAEKETAPEYKEAVDGVFTYRVYADHAEIAKCSTCYKYNS